MNISLKSYNSISKLLISNIIYKDIIKYNTPYLQKYGVELFVASFAKKPTELRGIYEIKSVCRLLKIKKEQQLHELVYATHPFDVVGWDGYNFPYKFSIHDFEPITGKIHQPPPVHQTFETNKFVICSFVPRLYDYHPNSVPAPYNHSNIDSDEVIYYVDGDFMSRNDINKGSITLHPAGIPHGPHPGAMEKSIGKKETFELAVMVDTFSPLMVTEEAVNLTEGQYHTSWLNKK